jgi:hypothetical protein
VADAKRASSRGSEPTLKHQDLHALRRLAHVQIRDAHIAEPGAGFAALRWTAACAYRKSSPSILVMQSTQDRTAQNVPRRLGGT